jgi:DNA modification methylase
VKPWLDTGDVQVFHGDCVEVMRSLPDASVDAVVTDPPYELAFMGKRWDATGIAYDLDVWREALRVLKPGGHLLAFGGTRTWHRLAVAIEDAGFEIRDNVAYLHDGGLPGPLAWCYGSGFPKSLDVSKAIDKAAGAEREVVGVGHGITGPATRKHQGLHSDDNYEWPSAKNGVYNITAPATPAAQQWQGWGTALKPAFEPIVVARKPLIGTVAENVLAHGTGALNIDGCRIGTDGGTTKGNPPKGASNGIYGNGINGACDVLSINAGRWPANVILDESQAAELDKQADELPSRFFYVAKANSNERPRKGDIAHPTVKPVTLLSYLVRLVTPPGGTVLEPFAGSGTTLEACVIEGFHAIGIEREADYLPLIEQRLSKPIQRVLA